MLLDRASHLATILAGNLLAARAWDVLARWGGGRRRLGGIGWRRRWLLSVVVGLEGGGSELLEDASHPLEAGRPVGASLRSSLLLFQVIC